MKKYHLNTENINNVESKIVIVTGGNSGIGFEAVKYFAIHGAKTIIACRSSQKGNESRNKIISEHPEAQIEVMQLDLTDLSSVKSFAENFKKKYSSLDILLNNAGIMTVPYSLTKDGFESQIGVNHFGHFALTGSLLEILKTTTNSRVVNVSSIAHKGGKILFDDIKFEKNYNPMTAYRRSKLANLLFTYELQRIFERNSYNSIALAAHPGVSQTNLFKHVENKFPLNILSPIARLMIQTADKGARPIIRACVDSGVKGGEYFGFDGYKEMSGKVVLVKSNEDSHNLEYAKKLWEVSQELTGTFFNEK